MMKHFCTVVLLACTAALCGLVSAAPEPARLYGHRLRVVAETEDLATAGGYRDTGRVVQLLAPAAEAFQRMQDAAWQDGVEVIPISGFRSSQYQAMLFERAVKKHGSRRKAARWTAPPGYSHHQTGMALDIGDGDRPDCDVRSCFRKTEAFSWLREHARQFGFRVTFSPSRPGVIGEPWHWHYEPALLAASPPRDSEPAGDRAGN